MAGSIEIRNLRVRRGSFVLDVPALDVHPHEIFAILGSTGSGKTVLMEAIALSLIHISPRWSRSCPTRGSPVR